jgi:hypothetical protein
MTDSGRLFTSASAWFAPATVIAAVVTGVSVGLGPALLVLAGGALLGAILLLWSSIGRLTGESPLTLEEAIGLAAPSPEEERKRSILRALKDLEFERSVGKISEEDFAELSQRYRAEAKSLLQSLEAELEGRRQSALEKLEKRLRKESLEPASASEPKKAPAEARSDAPPPSETDAVKPETSEKVGPPAEASPRTCSSCSAKNDADARFCKRCGATLAPEEAAP